MEPNIPGMGLLYFSITGKEDEGADPTPPPGSKRRRLRGACAECRARKIRCDRAKQPGNVCSNCIAFNCPCTDPRVDRAAEDLPPQSTLDGLESRPYGRKTAAEHVETIVVNSTAYIEARDVRPILLKVAQYSRSIEEELKACKAQLAALRARSSSTTDVSTPSSDQADSPDGASSHTVVNTHGSPPSDSQVEEEADALVEDFQGMKLTEDGRSRYFGESSNQHLFYTAEVFKSKNQQQVSNESNARRLQFWKSPWEKAPISTSPKYTFPPRDLLDSLVALYFRHWNIFIPLLHRPTLQKAIDSGLHLRDPKFGSVVLGVCALGSRLSDDPRVIYPGTNTKLSAGWAWMQQIQYPENPDHYFVMSLHDLQRSMLTTLYMQGSSSPRQCWALGGTAIRNLQDLGRHREKRYPEVPTVEDELYRRAFWAFIFGDVYMSAFLGRPRATSEDEHDVELPTECDDEYWEHEDPAKRWKQPQGKPSTVAFFLSNMKLLAILGRAERTIYSLQRNERGAGWAQATVAELDADLNRWLDSIPDHLRWDPHRETSIFSVQSAALYVSYYHVQIQIHRSFIPSPSNDAPLFSSFPSLAICSNAARAVGHVMETQTKAGVFIFHPQGIAGLMDSALVLLVNVWGARQSGSSSDPSLAADIQRCIASLAVHESRLQLPGRFCDLLASISNQLLISPPLPAVQPRKRPRDVAEDHHRHNSMSPPATWRRATASPPSVHQQTAALHAQSVDDLLAAQFPLDTLTGGASGSIHPSVLADLDMDAFAYSMPISTEELGHLPPYYNSSAFEQGWTTAHDATAARTATATAMSDMGLMFSFADAEAQGMIRAISPPGGSSSGNTASNDSVPAPGQSAFGPMPTASSLSSSLDYFSGFRRGSEGQQQFGGIVAVDPANPERYRPLTNWMFNPGPPPANP